MYHASNDKLPAHDDQLAELPAIDVVIPCFRVSGSAPDVVRRCLDESFVRRVYVVDDACPEGTGDRVHLSFSEEPRVVIIKHEHNQGVGGAVISGFARAFANKADIVVKVDGDGQMDPADIRRLLRPIISGKADYVKGNRFFYRKDLSGMPRVRLIGNAFLSLVNKFASGYWSIMDPTNGFVAIHRVAYARLDVETLDRRFFFESDMLFQLGVVNAVVADVPLRAHYGNEKSNLSVPLVLLEFPRKYVDRFIRRITFKYFVREFNIASLELMCGIPLLVMGSALGIHEWLKHYRLGEVTPAGTVMIVGLLIIIGFQLVLSVLNYDISREPVQPLLEAEGDHGDRP